MLIGSLCDSGSTHSVGFQEHRELQRNFLVDHVNQSVTNFTYLLIMARLLEAMINDYEEYILCYVKTFVYSLLIYHFILRSLFSFTYDCEYTI